MIKEAIVQIKNEIGQTIKMIENELEYESINYGKIENHCFHISNLSSEMSNLCYEIIKKTE